MGGLIHPIGPEEKQTYWLRRAIVLAVLVALLVVVGVVIGNIRNAQATAGAAAEPAANGPDQAVEPAGNPAADQPAAPTPTPESTPTPSAPATGAPSSPPPAEPGQPARTVEQKQGTTEQQAAQPPAQPQQSAQPPQQGQPQQGQPQQQGQPAQPPAPAQPGPCDPKKMRVTLNGPRQVAPGVPATFKMSIINGSGAECFAEVNKDTFELKVYSGTDRVWTSLDCLSGLVDRRELLQPEKTLEWQLEWGVNRSKGQCQTSPAKLRPGTYVATAQVKGADPVQNVLQLR